MAFVKKHSFKIAVLALCAVMAVYLLMSKDAGGQPLDNYGPAPTFELADLDGITVTKDDTNGKVRLYYFYFSYCPDVCPITTSLLADVQDEMKEQGKFPGDVVLTSITIDPQRDTPERLREYASRFGADFSGWHFLRGDEAKTHEIAKSFGLTVIKADNQISHTNFIFLVDRNGDIRKYIKADELTDADAIIQDINKLMKE